MTYTVILSRFLWAILAMLIINLFLLFIVVRESKLNVYTILDRYSKREFNFIELRVIDFLERNMLPRTNCELRILEFKDGTPPKFNQSDKTNFVFLEYKVFTEIVQVYEQDMDNLNDDVLGIIYEKVARNIFSYV